MLLDMTWVKGVHGPKGLKTWIKQNLPSLLQSHLRDYNMLMFNRNAQDFLILPCNKIGLFVSQSGATTVVLSSRRNPTRSF